MNDFELVMNKIKTILNITSDAKIAEKIGISKGNYSERKQRDSLPYENLIILCKKEKISTDFLFEIKENIENDNNYKQKLDKTIKKLNEKESIYFYHMIESKLAEKEI